VAALRATQFYLGTPPVVGGVDTWTVVYTVPVGKRIILKDIEFINNAAAVRTMSVRVDGVLQIGTPNVAATTTNRQQLYLVLNAGQTLGVFQRAAGGTSYGLSGYLLFV